MTCSPTSSACAARWTSCSATCSSAGWRPSAAAASRRPWTSTTRAIRRGRSSAPTSPGVDPAGIALEIRGRELILSGARPPESGDGRVYQQLEIPHGPFRRVVALGADVDADAASAAYEDGMLIVELPLAPPTRPQTVRIEPERRDGP